MTDNTAMPAVPPVAPDMDAETVAAVPRRTLTLLGMLLPAIVLTFLLVISERRPMREADFASKAIPASFAGARVWSSTSMKLSEEEMEILETRDYVYRSYSERGGNGAAVDLCLVFSEDNRKGTHPPDVCLEASGFRILSRNDRVVTLPDKEALGVRELVTTTTTGDSNTHYLYFAYFYKCGETFTTSFYKQQVQIVWNGLTRRNASGALVRFSTPMTDFGDLAAARTRTDELMGLVMPSIREHLR